MSEVIPMPGVDCTGEQPEPKHKVIDLPVITKLDLDPDRVLQSKIGKLETVVIIGYDHDGNETFTSNISDGGTVIWMLERTKHRLLLQADDGTAQRVDFPGNPA